MTTAVEVIDANPVNVVALAPNATAVLPTVTVLFANCAFGIELVPNCPVPLLYDNPDPAATLKDPNKTTVPAASGKVIVRSAVGLVAVKVVSKSFALDPSKTIFPLASFIEFAASADPEISVVPTNVVEVKEDKPVNVVTVPPRLTEVDPIVTAELAKLLLAIEDAVDNIVPVSFGKVKVLSPPVASAAVSIVSFASAVDPSKIIFSTSDFNSIGCIFYSCY